MTVINMLTTYLYYIYVPPNYQECGCFKCGCVTKATTVQHLPFLSSIVPIIPSQLHSPVELPQVLSPAKHKQTSLATVTAAKGVYIQYNLVHRFLTLHPLADMFTPKPPPSPGNIQPRGNYFTMIIHCHIYKDVYTTVRYSFIQLCELRKREVNEIV